MQNQDLKETYNRIAEDWVTDHDNDTWWQEGTDQFLSLLPKDAAVLDVGCGGGIKTNYIGSKEYKVTGTDFSEKMIEVAKKKFPSFDFAVMDLYEADKYPKTFDGIFAQAVLLHIQKSRIMEVLEKLKSRLNADGLLYIAVKGKKDGGVDESVTTENDYGYEYQRFFSYYTMDELKSYLQKLDMKIVWENVKKSGGTDWVQVVGRKLN
jgi:SAM-dependent methyltransferase